MKKFRLALASAVAAVFLLGSCSNNDDEPAGTLEGRWTPIKTITVVNGGSETEQAYSGNEAACDKDYREFLTGGLYRFVILYQNVQNVCTEDVETSTWSKSGNTLTITQGVDESGTYEITKLTNSELRYKSVATTGGVQIEVTQVFSRL